MSRFDDPSYLAPYGGRGSGVDYMPNARAPRLSVGQRVQMGQPVGQGALEAHLNHLAGQPTMPGRFGAFNAVQRQYNQRLAANDAQHAAFRQKLASPIGPAEQAQGNAIAGGLHEGTTVGGPVPRGMNPNTRLTGAAGERYAPPAPTPLPKPMNVAVGRAPQKGIGVNTQATPATPAARSSMIQAPPIGAQPSPSQGGDGVSAFLAGGGLAGWQAHGATMSRVPFSEEFPAEGNFLTMDRVSEGRHDVPDYNTVGQHAPDAAPPTENFAAQWNKYNAAKNGPTRQIALQRSGPRGIGVQVAGGAGGFRNLYLDAPPMGMTMPSGRPYPGATPGAKQMESQLNAKADLLEKQGDLQGATEARVDAENAGHWGPDHMLAQRLAREETRARIAATQPKSIEDQIMGAMAVRGASKEEMLQMKAMLPMLLTGVQRGAGQSGIGVQQGGATQIGVQANQSVKPVAPKAIVGQDGKTRYTQPTAESQMVSVPGAPTPSMADTIGATTTLESSGQMGAFSGDDGKLHHDPLELVRKLGSGFKPDSPEGRAVAAYIRTDPQMMAAVDALHGELAPGDKAINNSGVLGLPYPGLNPTGQESLRDAVARRSQFPSWANDLEDALSLRGLRYGNTPEQELAEKQRAMSLLDHLLNTQRNRPSQSQAIAFSPYPGSPKGITAPGSASIPF